MSSPDTIPTWLGILIAVGLIWGFLVMTRKERINRRKARNWAKLNPSVMAVNNGVASINEARAAMGLRTMDVASTYPMMDNFPVDYLAKDSSKGSLKGLSVRKSETPIFDQLQETK